jgi:hypothetical protein
MQALKPVSEQIYLILTYLKRKILEETMYFYHKSKDSEEGRMMVMRNYQVNELTKTSSRFPSIAHIKYFPYRFLHTMQFIKNRYPKSTMDNSFINSFTTSITSYFHHPQRFLSVDSSYGKKRILIMQSSLNRLQSWILFRQM